MFLSARVLELKKIRFDLDLTPGEVDFGDAKLRQVGPLHVAGEAELLSNTLGEIRVQGGLNVNLESECARCLDTVTTPLKTQFDLFYRPVVEDGTPNREVEIDSGETELAFYNGDGIELADVLREHILLTLPMRIVCAPDCEGICPQCGLNKKEGTCRCETRLKDDRWSALERIKESLRADS